MPLPRSSERQGKRSLRRAALVASAALIFASLAILRDGWFAEPLVAGTWFVAFLVAAGFAVALLAEIVAEVRGERISIQLTEIPLVFGLVYMAPWELAAVWIVAGTLAGWVRHKAPWFKGVFNASTVLLRVSIATAILLLSGAAFDSPLGLMALTLGVTAAETFGLVLVTGFVRFVENRPFSGIATDIRGAGFSLVGATVGSWGLIAGLWNPVLLILPLLVVFLWWRFSRQQMQDRQAYKDLVEVHAFLKRVAETEPVAVISEGLESLRSALSCDWAALVREGGETVSFAAKSGYTPTEEHSPLTAASQRQLPDGRIVLLGPSPHRGTEGSDSLFSTAFDLFESALRRAELQVQLEFDASHDPTTGLLGRGAFIQAVDQQLGDAEGLGAILVVDLTRFGEVNKTLGFKAGDILLRETSLRLTANASAGAIAARLNADSFAVFLPTDNHQVVLDVAGRIREDLSRSVEVQGLQLTPLCRIGIAIGPVHGRSAEQLLRAADVASELASGMHPPVTMYRIETDVHSESRLELLTRLKVALDNGQLDVWYQPKLDAISGRTIGVEALVRWNDNGHWIPPDLFIPAAEAAGMMNDLTDVVLTQALRSVAAWRSEGFHLGVAVNLSPSSLEDPALPARVASGLRRFNIDPPSLTIEITESVVMGMGPVVTEGLARIRALGVRLSVDDFGTGYSSLRYLKDLDIDELKLDRSFVQDLAVLDRSATIARAVIGLGHNLGLQVVAEGVETVEAEGLLREMGCDVLQGFLIARPMEKAKMDRWLARQRASRLQNNPTRMPHGITSGQAAQPKEN